MKRTIIEVERKTGIPSTKIRFWIKKGLFPFLQSDKNNVHYFSESDIEALRWVVFKANQNGDKDYQALYGFVYAGRKHDCRAQGDCKKSNRIYQSRLKENPRDSKNLGAKA